MLFEASQFLIKERKTIFKPFFLKLGTVFSVKNLKTWDFLYIKLNNFIKFCKNWWFMFQHFSASNDYLSPYFAVLAFLIFYKVIDYH